MDNPLLPHMTEPDLLRVIVLINFEPTFEFTMKCRDNVPLKALKDKFQKSFDGIIKQKVVYKDKECSISAQLHLPALNTKEYFINITQGEYQSITKSLFFNNKNAKSAAKLPPIVHTEVSKVEVVNESTAESKPEKAVFSHQVSKFEIKEDKNVPIQPQETRQPAQAVNRPAERIQPEVSSLKIYPQTNNETTMNNISGVECPPTTKAPVAQNKSCCALI